MRCKYCVYGDNYFYTRNHGDFSLQLCIAKQTLDYIKNNIFTRKDKHLTLAFAGGEPLLNFEIIKEIVFYCKTHFREWDLKFHLTTNGTVLSKEILNFLVFNKFNLVVSLDGPPKVHNNNRQFIHGGETHDVIIGNLSTIKNLHPDYFSSICFNCVYTCDGDFMKQYEFFSNNILVNKNRVLVSPVAKSNSSFQIEKRFRKNNPYNLIVDLIFKKVKNKINLNNFEYAIYRSLEVYNNTRLEPRTSSLSGCCKIDSSLFVGPDGNFHICENMTNKYSIGNSLDGYDFDKMNKYIKAYLLLRNSTCSVCKERFLCAPCFIIFQEKGAFKINSKYCQAIKYDAYKIMEKFLSLHS
jgi:uncharacterized protein